MGTKLAGDLSSAQTMSSGGLSRILVATDFSPHADRALEWAAALALRFSAELEIATSVYVVPFAAVPVGYGMPPDYLRGVREAADRRLGELAARLAGAGLRVRHTVLHEDPSSGICAWARAEYEKVRATLAGVSVEFDLRYGAADAALLDAAARHHSDAIVIGTQGRTGLAHMWLGSVAERVIRRASLPVFSAKST